MLNLLQCMDENEIELLLVNIRELQKRKNIMLVRLIIGIIWMKYTIVLQRII